MPLSRRQILLRRRVLVFGSLGALLATGIYLPMTLLAPLPPVSAQVEPFSAPVGEALSLNFPDFGATGVGAVGYDEPLALSGNKKPVPIASITKVITVLVVLDEKPLAAGDPGPKITTTAQDVDIYNRQVARNGSVAPVSAGLTFSQRELMQLILVKSANNYSETLVNWAFGNEDKYLTVARAWLIKHGLDDTSLADATGLSSGNKSTTSDLLELGKLALAHPVVSEIVDSPSVLVSNLGTIKNTNDLLAIKGMRGVKTGTTDDAGACLLFATDYVIGEQTVTVVGVMLGGKDHPTLNARIKALLKTVKASFHKVELIAAGEPLARFTTPWGDRSTAVAASSSSVVVWSDTPVAVEIDLDTIVQAREGQDVGDLIFTVGDDEILVDLTLQKAIDDPGPWWRITHPAEVF